MINSDEHVIYPAYNVKMSTNTIFGILTFVSKMNTTYEHFKQEKISLFPVFKFFMLS